MLSIDKANWTVAQQIDWYLVLAELNGYDFNQRVLKPWQRDPAFYKSIWTYQSDVPAHEGPTHHLLTELWTYQFPLSEAEQQRLTADLAVIPPLLQQARSNLTGNAKELWVAGIRDIKSQKQDLLDYSEKIQQSENAQLSKHHQQALAATEDFVDWLSAQSQHKTDPSGIGKEHYNWYQKHVHLLPMSCKMNNVC